MRKSTSWGGEYAKRKTITLSLPIIIIIFIMYTVQDRLTQCNHIKL